MEQAGVCLAEETRAGQQVVAIVGLFGIVRLTLCRRPEAAQSIASVDLEAVSIWSLSH